MALTKPGPKSAPVPSPSRASSSPVSPAPSDGYIGTALPRRRGRLRLDYGERFQAAGGAGAPPAETSRDRAWQRANYVTRSLAVWSFIARIWAANRVNAQDWAYLGGEGRTEERMRSRTRRLAAYSRRRLLALGPTMIKVGQLVSSRADLFPREVVEELQFLQDKVPAFDWHTAERVLKREYGREVGEVFAWFEKTPLAAASLGQVHRARLWSGEEVVVKIQRPGLKRLFDLDLYALKVVVEILQRSKTYGGKDKDWIGIYEECASVLYQEIDYVREGESCMRFRRNFEDANVDYVRVPKVYFEYTTPTVLCMQYLPGIKISDTDTLQRANLDLKLVANRVANAFIMQVLEHTFFTCDPHPGNCAVGANESIIFYDFGMVSELNPRIKERLIDILEGVLAKDAQIVMDALVDLNALVLPADPTPVRRSIQFFLDSIGNRPSRDQTVAAIGDDLYATAYDKPFRLPAASVFLLRAFSTLEGLARGLDPDFKFSEVALPYADTLLADRVQSPQRFVSRLARGVLTGTANEATDQLSKSVVSAGSEAVKTVSRIQKIEKAITSLERGDVKLKARSTETEKMLRKQYGLSEASNYLLSTGTTAVVATQLYVSGNMEPAAIMAALSAGLGLAFIRMKRKLGKKDPYSLD